MAAGSTPLVHLGEASSPHIGRLDRVAHAGLTPRLGQAVRPAVRVADRVAGACISSLNRTGSDHDQEGEGRAHVLSSSALTTQIPNHSRAG